MNDILKEKILRGENEEIDFKSNFNPDSPSEWIDLIKDIVAFANTSGGLIIIGLNDDGSISTAQKYDLSSIDPADVTNKIYKYTDYQFCGFSILKDIFNGSNIFIFEVKRVDIPIVFTKPGTYAVENNKQRTVFSVGTVYFRHGAKSEPGNTDDFRKFLERQLESIRKSWLSGIAKVVEAPAGSKVVVVSAEIVNSESNNVSQIRITDDPSAPAFRAVKVDETHPYRQMDIARIVNKRLEGKVILRRYDIQRIRRKYNLDNNIQFCYTMKFASPRFSKEFAEWIITQITKEPDFYNKL
jgi:hypothetical protein